VEQVVEPLTIAVGGEARVTVALPLDVPPAFTSDTDVTEYVVVSDGITLRVARGEVSPLWVTPSDQVIDHGAAPVRFAMIVAGAAMPHDAPPPVTVAVGADHACSPTVLMLTPLLLVATQRKTKRSSTSGSTCGLRSVVEERVAVDPDGRRTMLH
jgi:hypothetical protein